MAVQKASEHKKLTAGLPFDVPINTHKRVNFINRSHGVYSRNTKDCKEESIFYIS